MNELLDQLIKHKGWSLAVEMIHEELDKYRDDISIDFPVEDIGKRFLAHKEATKVIKDAINRIESAASGEIDKPKKTYR